MTKRHSTKKALMLSLLSLIVCVSMLIGTTFAWFTDSVTSSGNKIVSGSLNIDLSVMDENGVYQSVKNSSDAIFGYTLWEPGYTVWKNLKVSTTGNLALKYAMNIVIKGERSILAEVIDVYYAASEIAKPADRNLNGLTRLGTISEVLDGAADALINDTLIPGQNTEDYATLVLKMQESAGNDYQNKTIGEFDINLFATQLTYEEDIFDDQYDKDATLPEVATGTVDGDDIDLKTGDITVTVPEEAGDADYRVVVDNKNIKTDATNATSVSFDISLLKDGVAVTEQPGVAYTVKVEVGPSLDITKVLHKGEAVTNYTYDSVAGILTFETASFSPFEIVYYEVPAGAVVKAKCADGKMIYFTSFADALAAAEDGMVMTLMDNVTLTNTAVFNKDVAATLDMNGKTVSGVITTLVKLADGQLTIKNGSFKNVHADATETKYGIYMCGDSKAEIKDVNIEVTGTGIYMNDDAHITELDANINTYVTVNGSCTFDGVSLLGNAKIDLISDGTYKTYFAESMFEAKRNGIYPSCNASFTFQLNSAGAYIGEIRGGTFIGAMDMGNSGTPIHVNNGTVDLISGGYFGFAEMSFQDATYMLYANTANGGKINKITGGTFEEGCKPVNIARYTGYGCDFLNIVAASGCKVEATGETVVRGNQLSSRVQSYTLNVVRVIPQ